MTKLFPSIKSLVVVVKIDGHNVDGLEKTHRFDENNLPDIVGCPDPLCGRGFQISVEVKDMADIREARKKGWAVCSGQRGASPARCLRNAVQLHHRHRVQVIRMAVGRLR